MNEPKIRILFVTIHAGIGGIERAFVNLINELSKTKRFEIDIFMFTHKGAFFDAFPNDVHFYPEDNLLRLIGITQKDAWNEGIQTGIKRLFLGGISKYISQESAYKIAMKNIGKMEGYNIVISFMQSRPIGLYGGTNELVLNKVSAKKYCTFIHNDLEKSNMITKYNYEIYRKFDKIASVSKSCEKLFIDTWPDLSEKACTVENCCNIDEIRELSNEEISYKRSGINFVTVARFGPEKGIVRGIKIFAKLKEYSNLYTWHIVGTGVEEAMARELIKQEGLEENIILHGEKRNPFPYMKQSDALFIPSYREAAPMVIQEAHVLGIPILSTETRSAREMIEDRKIGIVCENSDKGIYQMLIKLLHNMSILKKIKTNIYREENNNRQIDQFTDMICV